MVNKKTDSLHLTEGGSTILHTLKCNPDIFDRIKNGIKTAEIRYNDRGFQTGDVIRLESYDKVKKNY